MIDFYFHKLNLVWLRLSGNRPLCFVLHWNRNLFIWKIEKYCNTYSKRVVYRPLMSMRCRRTLSPQSSAQKPPPVNGGNLSDEHIFAYQSVCNTDFEFEFESYEDHPWNGMVPKGREEIFHSHQTFDETVSSTLGIAGGLEKALRHSKDVDPIFGIITLAWPIYVPPLRHGIPFSSTTVEGIELDFLLIRTSLEDFTDSMAVLSHLK